jgi:hypothetical protein
VLCDLLAVWLAVFETNCVLVHLVGKQGFMEPTTTHPYTELETKVPLQYCSTAVLRSAFVSKGVTADATTGLK